jgi:hypothetical protein
MKKILITLLVLLATTAYAADQITLPSFIPLYQVSDTTQISVKKVTLVEAGDSTKLLADGQEFILSMEYSDAICWYINLHYVAFKLGYISKKQFRYLEKVYKTHQN